MSTAAVNAPAAEAAVTPLPVRGLSEWLDAPSRFAREGGEVTRLRGAWLFGHPDAVRDVLVTRDRAAAA